MILLALACVCSPDAPRLGGALLSSDGATDTGDTGYSDVTTVSITGTVAAIETLNDAESPSASPTLGVNGGFNGPWTHLTLDTEDGPKEAWFLAGAPGLVAVGETVTIDAGLSTDDIQMQSFALVDAAGVRRLWVGQVVAMYGRYGDITTRLQTPEGVTVTSGEEACRSSSRCQDVLYHDLVVTVDGNSHDLPYGETVTIDGNTYIHGGQEQYIGVSTAFTCGEIWGLADTVTLAIVAADAFEEEALWP